MAALTEAALRERLDLIEAAGLRLRVDTVPTAVLADEAMLVQVCSNLIDNAITHNQPGGTITVRCGTEPGEDHPHGVLQVSNDGRVLDPAAVDALREPFHRGERSRLQHPQGAPGEPAAAGTGLGLGLAIVEEIATRHGGHLRLAALPDGGLAARVELPAPTSGARRTPDAAGS
nr:sensor histidine kinase [Cellulomonas hominis]